MIYLHTRSHETLIFKNRLNVKMASCDIVHTLTINGTRSHSQTHVLFSTWIKLQIYEFILQLVRCTLCDCFVCSMISNTIIHIHLTDWLSLDFEHFIVHQTDEWLLLHTNNLDYSANRITFYLIFIWYILWDVCELEKRKMLLLFEQRSRSVSYTIVRDLHSLVVNGVSCSTCWRIN